ncbi:hypothetical protein [Microcystis phage Mvi-JY20]|uniref:Uncharacterized protein n=1 Tax=Microcystis phage Mvi-JY20 TaxID=3128146 RepID=A0AAX4QGQ0_9CAUD
MQPDTDTLKKIRMYATCIANYGDLPSNKLAPDQSDELLRARSFLAKHAREVLESLVGDLDAYFLFDSELFGFEIDLNTHTMPQIEKVLRRTEPPKLELSNGGALKYTLNNLYASLTELSGVYEELAGARAYVTELSKHIEGVFKAVVSTSNEWRGASLMCVYTHQDTKRKIALLAKYHTKVRHRIESLQTALTIVSRHITLDQHLHDASSRVDDENTYVPRKKSSSSDMTPIRREPKSNSTRSAQSVLDRLKSKSQ